MKCLSCSSENIDPGKFDCNRCGKVYKKLLLDGGRIAFESQCDCHKKFDRMKIAIPMDVRPQEIQRIVNKNYPDPMPFSRANEGVPNETQDKNKQI